MHSDCPEYGRVQREIQDNAYYSLRDPFHALLSGWIIERAISVLGVPSTHAGSRFTTIIPTHWQVLHILLKMVLTSFLGEERIEYTAFRTGRGIAIPVLLARLLSTRLSMQACS
jgi:hypothetical protein